MLTRNTCILVDSGINEASQKEEFSKSEGKTSFIVGEL